jgi:hypothetical protein
MIVAELFPDKFAIIAQWEPGGQSFLYVPGEDGDMHFEAIGKTIYQVLNLIFQKNIYCVHVRKITSFNYKNKISAAVKTIDCGIVLLFCVKSHVLA